MRLVTENKDRTEMPVPLWFYTGAPTHKKAPLMEGLSLYNVVASMHNGKPTRYCGISRYQPTYVYTYR